jgi:hypothetical protein
MEVELSMEETESYPFFLGEMSSIYVTLVYEPLQLYLDMLYERIDFANHIGWQGVLAGGQRGRNNGTYEKP